MEKKKIDSNDVNVAVAPYLKLKNNEYYLDLSKEQSLDLGIIESDYNKIEEQIQNTNNKIKSLKKDSNKNVVLLDPQRDVTKEEIQAVMPSGHLSTSGQEETSTSFFAPFEATQVRFRCKGNAAPFPFLKCRTYAFGGSKQKTVIGSSSVYTNIDVDIAASNTYVDIYFSTSDSNGGVCDWKAMA